MKDVLDSAYREAAPKDIVEGNVVYILGDDDNLHEMEIDEVLKPSDDWKAFVANDGGRYGLDGCFVKITVDTKTAMDSSGHAKQVSRPPFPFGCMITNIRRGSGERKKYVYADLISPTGELLIAATLDYINQQILDAGTMTDSQ